MARLQDVTIVVATLPRSYLQEWINQTLNYAESGVRVIISLPPHYSHSNLPRDFHRVNNISIVTSPKGGQVSQRAYGFSLVLTPYALQMDDDIILSISSLCALLNDLGSLGGSSCVAPRLISLDSDLPLQSNPSTVTALGLSRYFLSFLIYGSGLRHPTHLYGLITPSGHGYVLPPSTPIPSPLRVDWLPGGCVLHSTRNLILDDYYPYSGKAYVEDLIHSYFLRTNSIILYYSPHAYALTPSPSPSLHPLRQATELLKEMRARSFYVRLTHLSILWFSISCLYVAVRYITGLILCAPSALLRTSLALRPK